MNKRFKFYNIERLISEYPDARYYIVIGERSNGKTYSTLAHALKKFADNGEEFAYIRRYGEDIRPKNLSTLFDSHIENGLVNELFDGKYNSIEYSGAKFYLIRRDSDGKKDAELEPVVIGRAFDLNGMDHYKSIAFPRITTIVFDEFLSRQGYIPNEFMLFQNALSTIIRFRDNVKIFMLGNTVNKYCPYFSEMGLKHINEQKQGTVDVYRYGESKLEVVVEYCESTSKTGGKASDVYFAFDNPQLKMITTGSWEIGVYPHLPVDYKPKDIVFTFFIEFDRDILQGQVINVPNYKPFIFLHNKTTPIKNETDIVYTTEPSINPYRRQGLLKHQDKVSELIRRYLAEGRVFYATNEVGEIFRNFLMWNQNNKIL